MLTLSPSLLRIDTIIIKFHIQISFIFLNLSMIEDSLNDETWISWFCTLQDHIFLCEIEEDYIKDNFNLYNLSS